MIGQLTYVEGAPCPTLVLDARSLPREEPALLAVLAEIRQELIRADYGHVLKIALIAPSTKPRFDLDYRFIQALPDGGFDLRGSCGHSMLGAALASPGYQMGPAPAPGIRTRVNVLNNGDRVTCEAEEVNQDRAMFTARFRYSPARAVHRLLLTGDPQTSLDVDGRLIPVSLVSTGNPYVFVDAASVGAPTVGELFVGGQELLDRLVRIRVAAATLLGWPATGAFPKVAAVLPDDGVIAVRAVSVPTWHPTLALTGSMCLAAASTITGTIPWRAAQGSTVTGLRTPGGRWPVSITAAMRDGVPHLAEVSVGRRQVTSYGSLELPVRLQREEVIEWPLSA